MTSTLIVDPSEGKGLTLKKSNEVTLEKPVVEWLGIRDNLEMLIGRTQLDMKSSYWLSRTYDRIEPKINRAVNDCVSEAMKEPGFEKLRDKDVNKLNEEEKAERATLVTAYEESFRTLSTEKTVTIDVFTIDVSNFVIRNTHIAGFYGKYFSILKDLIVGEPNEEAMAFLL